MRMRFSGVEIAFEFGAGDVVELFQDERRACSSVSWPPMLIKRASVFAMRACREFLCPS